MSTPNLDSAEKLRVKEAEELAKYAIEDGISGSQIKPLYGVARNKGLVYFEIYMKYKMGKSDNRGRYFISKRFGSKILSLITEYQKHDLIKILKYLYMLYDYTKQSTVSDDLKAKIENVIQKETIAFGCKGIMVEPVKEGKLKIHIRLTRFFEDPKVLSKHLNNVIKVEVKELDNTLFYTWIEKEVKY